MRPNLPTVATLILMMLAGAHAVRAQTQGIVELKMVAEIEVEVKGADGEIEVQRVQAQTVVPGDEVIYTILYTNVGEEPAGRVVVTNPIPEHMLYNEGSVWGEGTFIVFSVDGGVGYDVPERLQVPGEDGELRPARPVDYTHIRWTLEEALAPAGQGEVGFRAVLQ